ncbi:MAG TPA: signal peptidase I [Erysipelothrix sp.]|nr:signal peptidase I [Erysipelothrix sp.]
MKKLFKLFEHLVFVLLVLLLSGYIFVQALPAETSLKLFRIKPFIVVSDSMSGVFEVGDLIVIKPLNTSEIQRGDIVTFYQDLNQDGIDEIVTHYVVDIQEEGEQQFFTKSNQHDRWDNWTLSVDDFIGQYWFRIPLLGYLFLLLREPLFWGIFIALGAGFFGFYLWFKEK